ncbi:MAG: GGDEF domain-containing protein [Firmicutes bacterium]|nr:GGDEF domain-containing protein [Bacillota bacterium]
MKLGEVFFAADENALMGVAFMKPDTDILTAENVVYDYLGREFSIKLADLIYDDDRAHFAAMAENCGKTPVRFSARCFCADKSYREVAFVMRKIDFNESSFIRVDMFDVEYMSKNYNKFLDTECFLQGYKKASRDIIFVYDTQNDIIHITRNGNNVFDGNMALAKERFASETLVAPDFVETAKALCDAIKQSNGSGCQLIESSIFDKDGEYKPVFVNYSAVEYNSFPFYSVGTISKDTFPDKSMFDPLTGLYNKREIAKLAAEALEDAKKSGHIIVFVIIDLDRFKEINDTYGHLAGDRALINAARIIKGVIGDRGIVGRMGGDEFFAFMPDFRGDHQTLRAVLRSIREHIRRYFLDCGQKGSCSIGASSYPKDSANYDELFKLADYCTYLAKTKGRNRFVIYKAYAHGTPGDILGKGMQFLGCMTEEEKTDHLLSVISRANNAEEGKYKQLLLTFMAEIKTLYGISAVQYCPARDNGRYAETTDYNIAKPRAFMDIYDTYSDKIDDRGYLALGNYMNSKEMLPDIADYMAENELCSLFIAPCTTEGNRLTGIFVMTSKIQYSWSDYDIDTLLALFAVLDRLTGEN